MALTNADKFRLALEAVSRGDIDGALAHVDPEVDWRPPPILPDAETYHGHEGVRKWMSTLYEAFEDLRLEPTGPFRELDEVHVLVPVRASARGRGSGVEVEAAFVMLGTGGDLLVRMEFFPTDEDALEAAGHKI